MQHSFPRINPVRARRAPRSMALALALAAALAAASSVHAQEGAATGVAVSDNVNQGYNKLMMAFQKGQQFTNAVSQLKQLTSTINTVASNPLASMMPTSGTMNRLTDAEIQSFMSAKCAPAGSSSGNIITDTVFNAVHNLDLTGNIAQSQQTICRNIITVQADQYNATVDLYKAVPELHNTVNGLQSLMTQLDGVLGNSSSSMAQSSTLTTMQQQTIIDWETRTHMDAQIITTLQQQQSALASQALNAKPELLGSAIQAVALKAAFTANQ